MVTVGLNILVVLQNKEDRDFVLNSFSFGYKLFFEQEIDKACSFLTNQSFVDVVLVDSFSQEPILKYINDTAIASYRCRVISVLGNEEAKSIDHAFDLGLFDTIRRPLNAKMFEHRINLAKAYVYDLDPVTNISSKESFFEKTREILSTNLDEEFTLARFDIDNFKLYNELYGMQEGNVLLQKIANCVKPFLKDKTVFCRYDSDHFVLFYKKGSIDIEKIINSTLFSLNANQKNFKIVFSIGIYENCDRNLSIEQMCERTLIALKTVKGKYSEYIAYYNDSYREQLLEEQIIIDEMASALKNGEFVIYLQPQYNQATKTIVGAEALARWVHPTRGVISPGKFIPVFEHTGFIVDLDNFIIHQACKLQRKWLDSNINPPPISVNMSIKDIEKEDFVKEITTIVKSYHLNPACIHIEITESVFMNNPNKIIQRVKDLQKNGFEVEMDDFGSGYSSLNTLKDVPVNVLKLDMRFLEGDSNQERSGRILSSIIRMAHWLDLSVIAEGVETKEQADLLMSMGCLYVQGYYMDKPMPVDVFEKKLQKTNFDNSGTLAFRNDNTGLNLLALDSDVYKFFSFLPVGAAIVEYKESTVELIRFNDKFFNQLGTTALKSRSENFLLRNSIKTADWPIFVTTLQKAIDSKSCAICNIQTQNGQFVRFWFSFLQQNRNHYYLFIFVDDNNQPIRTQLELTDTKNKLKTIVDTMDGGMINFVFTQSLKLVDCDTKFAHLLGFTRSEILNIYKDNPLSGVHPDDVNKLLEMLKYHQENNAPFVKIDFRQICKDGSYKHVSYSISFSYYPNKIKIAAIVTDITALKQAKEKLEQQKNLNNTLNSRLNSVKNLTPFYSITIKYDAEGFSMVSCNRAFASLLGYETSQEIIQIGLEQFIENHIAKADQKSLLDIKKRLLSQKNVYANKYATSFRLVTKKKEVLDAHIRLEQTYIDHDSFFVEIVLINTSNLFSSSDIEGVVHFSKILDEMGIACFYIDLKKQQTVVSSSIYKYALSNNAWANVDYLSKEVMDTIHPDDISTFAKLLKRTNDTKVHKLHVRLKTITNVFAPVNIFYVYNFDSNQEPESLLINIMPDTKAIAQAPMPADEKQVLTENYFGFGIFELRANDGLYQQFADENLVRMLGYTLEESDLRSKLKSKGILDFDNSFYEKDNIDKLLSKPEHNEIYQVRLANGLLKWVNIFIHVSKNTKKTLLHIAVQKCPKKMEELIEQSIKIEDHNTLLSTLSIGMLKYYEDTKELVAINATLLNFLGYTQGELYDLCNKNFENLVYQEDANQLSDIRELRIRNKNGQLIWFKYIAKHIDIYTIASLTPIQEEKNLLQMSRTQYDLNVALQKLSKSGFMQIKILGNRWSFISASQELLNILGYTNEELKILLREDILHLVHNDDKGSLRQTSINKYKDSQEFNIEFRVKCKDASYHWFAVKDLFTNESGIDYCYSIWMDITHLKKQEINNQRKENYYQHILNAFPGGVATFEVHPNNEHKLLYASEGFPRIFNIFDMDEFKNLTNNHNKRYTYKEDISILEESIDKMLKTFEAFELNLRIVRDDGSMIWVKSKTCIIDNHNGNPVYLCILQPI